MSQLDGTGVWDQEQTEQRPSTRSPVVDKESIRPEQWLRLVFCALTLMVGW